MGWRESATFIVNTSPAAWVCCGTDVGPENSSVGARLVEARVAPQGDRVVVPRMTGARAVPFVPEPWAPNNHGLLNGARLHSRDRLAVSRSSANRSPCSAPRRRRLFVIPRNVLVSANAWDTSTPTSAFLPSVGADGTEASASVGGLGPPGTARPLRPGGAARQPAVGSVWPRRNGGAAGGAASPWRCPVRASVGEHGRGAAGVSAGCRRRTRRYSGRAVPRAAGRRWGRPRTRRTL